MHNLTPEKELQILEGLKIKLETVPGISNVIIDDEEFSTKRDSLEAFTVKNSDKEREVKYAYVTLDYFEDSKDDGCDDNPFVTLSYSIHLVQQFIEKRKNGTTPKNDFKALYLNIRNKFLEMNRSVPGAQNCETQPVKRKTPIILDDDPMTGVYSYFADLDLKVTIW